MVLQNRKLSVFATKTLLFFQGCTHSGSAQQLPWCEGQLTKRLFLAQVDVALGVENEALEEGPSGVPPEVLLGSLASRREAVVRKDVLEGAGAGAPATPPRRRSKLSFDSVQDLLILGFRC